jgi:tetratricopeptide (TPR) repeat protein
MLLVLLENLDTLLTKQIKNQQDIHRFRSFLMDSPCITLVATSPFYFPGMYDIKSPLYDFFDVQILEDLSENQIVEMIRQNLIWEKKNDILEKYDALIPKIKAIHVMTGGNPRLIMMLYELVANDNILDVKLQFQKLLDQISPFYQDRLKELAPQERAIIETMALMRTIPKTPAAIAKQLRKKPQLISAPLQRMAQAGYLTVIENPNDKRSRIYRIKEGFFDLWLAMSESRLHKQRIPYLVDFFSYYYKDQADREEKRQQLLKECSNPECNQIKLENSKEILDYLSEIGDKDEKLIAKAELAVAGLKEVKKEYAVNYLKEIEPLSQQIPFMNCFILQAVKEPQVDIFSWFNSLIEYWKIQRAGDLEQAAQIAQKTGYDLSAHGLHNIRIELLKDALEHSGSQRQKYQIMRDIAESLIMIGLLDDAVNHLNQTLSIANDLEDSSLEVRSLVGIGIAYQSKGSNDQALGYYQDALEIAKRTGDTEGEAGVSMFIGMIYHQKEAYDQALNHYQQSLAINKRIKEEFGESKCLQLTGDIYHLKGLPEQALKYYQHSLEISKRIGDLTGEVMSLGQIGLLFIKLQKYIEAFEYSVHAYQIMINIGSPDVDIVRKHLLFIQRNLPPDQFQSLCVAKGISLEELEVN